ncbi:hypothetical protein HK101_008988 [Irineochytrium annulatum]|nr:hypothetical protein HK101_008988 [Irineochytrium annulatum]
MTAFRDVMRHPGVHPLVAISGSNRQSIAGAKITYEPAGVQAAALQLNVDATPLFAAICWWSSFSPPGKPAANYLVRLRNKYDRSNSFVERAAAHDEADVAVCRDVVKYYLSLRHPLMTDAIINLAARAAAAHSRADCVVLILSDSRVNTLSATDADVKALHYAIENGDADSTVTLLATRKIPLTGRVVRDLAGNIEVFRAVKRAGIIADGDSAVTDVIGRWLWDHAAVEVLRAGVLCPRDALTVAFKIKALDICEEILLAHWHAMIPEDVVTFAAELNLGLLARLLLLVSDLATKNPFTKGFEERLGRAGSALEVEALSAEIHRERRGVERRIGELREMRRDFQRYMSEGCVPDEASVAEDGECAEGGEETGHAGTYKSGATCAPKEGTRTVEDRGVLHEEDYIMDDVALGQSRDGTFRLTERLADPKSVISPLIDLACSCRLGFISRVESLLANHANLAITGKVIHNAIVGRHEDVLKFLLKSDRLEPGVVDNLACLRAVDLSVNVFRMIIKTRQAHMQPGELDAGSILRAAVTRGKIDIVRCITKIFDLTASSTPPTPPLAIASLQNALNQACLFGETEIAAYLLTLPNVDPGFCDGIALSKAISGSSKDAIRLLLKTRKSNAAADANAHLRRACEDGLTDVVSLLLTDSAVAIGSGRGRALTVAAEFGYADIVRQLLATNRITGHAGALRAAARNGHGAALRLLLACPESDPSSREHLALRLAAGEAGSEEIVTELLQACPDGVPTGPRLKALSAAAKSGNAICVMALLRTFSGEGKRNSGGVRKVMGDQGDVDDATGDGGIRDAEQEPDEEKDRVVNVDAGGDVTASLSSICESAFRTAAKRGRVETLRVLWESGHVRRSVAMRTHLNAIWCGREDVVGALLGYEELRVGISARLLDSAVRAKNPGIVRQLWSLPQSAFAGGRKEISAAFAVKFGGVDVLRCLFDVGALNRDPNGADYWVAMASARETQRFEIVQYLVDNWGGNFEEWARSELPEVRRDLVLFIF